MEQPVPCAQPKQDGSLPPPPYLPPPPLLFTCSLTFSPFHALCLHPSSFERLQIVLFFYFATPQITPKLVQAVLFIYFICPSDVCCTTLFYAFLLPVGLKTVRRNQTLPVDFGMNFLMLAFHKIWTSSLYLSQVRSIDSTIYLFIFYKFYKPFLT